MIYKSIIAIFISLVINTVCATTTFRIESHNKRIFLNLIKQNKSFQVSVFKQNKGHYQELLESKDFSNIIEFNLWKNEKYPLLVEGNLSRWSIAKDDMKRKSKVFWDVENSWNTAWEKKYAKWIEEEVDSKFFYRHNIETDCADIVVGMRWIFARENKLPAGNRLASTGDLFTQDDVPRKWRKMSRATVWYKDELFIRALNFLMNSTSSWSLERDSFPVKLDRDGLIAGRYIINNKNDSWHTRIFSESDYKENHNIPLYTWASTAPRDNRILIKEIYLDEGWPTDGALEVLAHKWPVRYGRSWRLANYNEHPDYGPEQFIGAGLESGKEFYKSLFERIKPSHSIASLLDFSLEEIKKYVEQRISIVKKGSVFCKKNNCSNGTLNWDNWSTPSRDSKLELKFSKYELIFSKYKYERGDVHKKWLNGLKSTFVELEGLKLSLSDILFIWNNKLYSSDPSVSLEKRWGLNFKDHFTSYSEALKKLFAKRNLRISDTDCSYDCTSGSGRWWDYHTYHIDAEIFTRFSMFNSLCERYGHSQKCLDIKADILSDEVEMNFEVLSLSEWEKRIPLFNSDPRATPSRKNGEYTSIDSYLFTDINTLFISKNNYALIDGQRVIDLISKSDIYTAKSDETIFLNNSGAIFIVNNFNLSVKTNEGFIELYRFASKVNFVQSKNSLIAFDNKSLISIDSENFQTTIHSKEEIISFNYFTDIFIIWTKTGGKIFSTDSFEVLGNLDSSLQGQLSAISLDYGFIVGQFINKDDDKYCAFTFTFINQEFTCLSPEKTKLEFYDSGSNTLAFSKDIDGIKKNIFVAQVQSNKLSNPMFLSNFLYNYKMTPQGLIILTDSGEYYSPSGKKTLYSYVIGEEIVLSILDKSSVSYFKGDTFFHYNSDDLGLLSISNKTLKTPSRIDFNVGSATYTQSSENALIWRFNSGKGDLEGVGGIVFNPLEFGDNTEIYPDISVGYGYLQASEARQKRLKEMVSNFKVNSGVVTALNQTNFLWIHRRH